MDPIIEIYDEDDNPIEGLSFDVQDGELTEDIKLYIWNNRGGDEKVDHFINPTIDVTDKEGGNNTDLINAFEIKIDGTWHVVDKTEITAVLSGEPNDGELKEENSEHYIEIKIRVKIPENIPQGDRNLNLHIIGDK